MNHEFDQNFREWVNAACRAWSLETPGGEYYDAVYKEIPEPIQSSVITAVRRGIVVPIGMQFKIKDGRGFQGPYSWFSRNRRLRPSPNREYFVHIAEFLRYQDIATREGMKAFFEFEAMDVSLYGDGRILLICEVKRTTEAVQRLLEGMKPFEKGIDYSEANLRYDPLSKAKYIQNWRPDYFCVAAIRQRREFKVTYPEGRGYSFHLSEGRVPWV